MIEDPAEAPIPREARLRRQIGQAVVLAALMIVALIGAMGLGIDLGNAASHQREDQSAADGAALAAADRISNDQTLGQATTAAQTVAALGGVPSGNLTVNYLDGSRNPTGNKDNVVWVQTKVTETVATFFMRAIGIGTVNVSALAEVRFPRKCAICLLDPSASPAADLSSGGTINVSGGCLQVNSSANPDTQTSGGTGSINAPCNNLVGTPGSPVLINPAPATGVAPVPDPLAKLPYPQPPVPAPTTYNGGGVYPDNTNTVAIPGVYSEWALGGSGNLYLQPGLYVITGSSGSGGVSVSSGGAIKNCPAAPCTGMTGTPVNGGPPVTVSPGGVTLFFTCSGYWPNSTGGSAGPICPCPSTVGAALNISSNGGLQITAPTSGPYQGVAIFFDRCNSASINLTANGGVGAPAAPAVGAIYAKAAALNLTANGAANLAGLVITATVTLSSNSNLNISYDPTNPAQAVLAQWLSWGQARLAT